MVHSLPLVRFHAVLSVLLHLQGNTTAPVEDLLNSPLLSTLTTSIKTIKVLFQIRCWVQGSLSFWKLSSNLCISFWLVGSAAYRDYQIVNRFLMRSSPFKGAVCTGKHPSNVMFWCKQRWEKSHQAVLPVGRRMLKSHLPHCSVRKCLSCLDGPLEKAKDDF